MNPQPSWEELLPFYGQDYAPYSDDFGIRGDLDEVVARARQTGTYRHVSIRPGLRILDVGCGGGSFLNVARRLGADVQGVELSGRAVEFARKNAIPVFEGTITDYADSESHGRFDVVTASHVIEHVPNPVETLAAMKQVLAEDGYIWLALPNADCFFGRRLRDRWSNADLPLHLMQFSKTSLTRAAEAAGLAVRSVATLSEAVFVASSVRQLLRYKLKMPRRLTNKIRWIDSRVAPWVAERLDRGDGGEAILAEFVPPE